MNAPASMVGRARAAGSTACLGLAVAVLASGLFGCSAVRTQVGVGLGLGAEVYVPAVLHTGLATAFYRYAGHDYVDGWHGWRDDVGFEGSFSYLIAHTCGAATGLRGHRPKPGEAEETGPEPDVHGCLGIVPIAFDALEGRPPTRSLVLGLDVHFVFFSVRLGFNPYFLNPGNVRAERTRRRARAGLDRAETESYDRSRGGCGWH